MRAACRLKHAQAATEGTGVGGDRGHPGLELARASADDRPLAALLDAHFDGRPGLLSEFPLLLDRASRARCRVFRKGDDYVAHASWRPLELALEGEWVRAAGIGLVTTHAAFRDLGLATRLVEACVEDATREGAELALLFGAARGLYTRLCFIPAGRERVTRVHTRERGPLCTDLVRAGSARDAAVLLGLLETQPLRVTRTLDEFRRLLAIPDMRVHVLEEEGAVKAYCIEGKGRDLQAVVHEWAGAPADVARVLEVAAASRPGPLHVLSPADRPPPTTGVHHVGHLAQMRILRPEAFGTSDPVRAFGDASRPGQRSLYVWGLDSI